MKLPFTGGCICGDIRYECAAEPIRMVNCHCRDCQQAGGAAYGPILIVPFNAFRITAGTLQRFTTTRVRGGQNVRGFCPRCGARLTVGEDSQRGLIGLMAGSLDDPASYKPAVDIFLCDAQPWDIMNPALPKHHEYAPRPQ